MESMMERCGRPEMGPIDLMDRKSEQQNIVGDRDIAKNMGCGAN